MAWPCQRDRHAGCLFDITQTTMAPVPMPSALSFELLGKCSVCWKRAISTRPCARLTPPGHESACCNAASAPRAGASAHLHARGHAGVAQGPHAGPAGRPGLPPLSQQHIPPVGAQTTGAWTAADTAERPQARTGRPRCHRRRAQAAVVAAQHAHRCLPLLHGHPPHGDARD
jgi:hypothetical protein